MMQNGYSNVVRYVQTLALVVVAAAVVWIGVSHVEKEMKLLPVVMCAGFAIMLLLTAATMAFEERGEAYETE